MPLAWRQGLRTIGLIGLLLSTAGLASFAYELHHWFMDDYRSIIVSPVIALLTLATVTAVQEFRVRRAMLKPV